MTWLISLFLFIIQMGGKDLNYDKSPGELLFIVHDLNNRIDSIASDVCGVSFPSDIKLLLITDTLEYLYNLQAPGGDFIIDPSLKIGGHHVFKRPTITYKGMMASYPLVKGVPCIVMGTPQNTGLTMDQWILTILHEHFHILQMNLPNYFKDVDALNLSGGDQSGMWMLNYDFPYNESGISQSLKYFGELIADSIEKKNERVSVISDALITLRNKLDPEDFRYMEFQLWQEGIARFIEYEYARYLAERGIIINGGSNNFEEWAIRKYHTGIKNLRNIDSEENKREVFYDLGWGIGIILKDQNDSWQDEYWSNRFKILNDTNE